MTCAAISAHSEKSCKVPHPNLQPALPAITTPHILLWTSAIVQTQNLLSSIWKPEIWFNFLFLPPAVAVNEQLQSRELPRSSGCWEQCPAPPQVTAHPTDLPVLPSVPAPSVALTQRLLRGCLHVPAAPTATGSPCKPHTLSPSQHNGGTEALAPHF